MSQHTHPSRAAHQSLANDSAAPLLALNAVVLDTETTGLDVSTDRLIQFGAVRIVAGIMQSETSDFLLNPGQAIPEVSTRIHHITNDMVRDAAHFSARVEQIERFCGEAVIIGHNIAFDLTILQKEYERINRPWQRPRALDTQLLARMSQINLPDYSLDTLTQKFGIDIKGRHSALGDARGTAELFLALVPLLARQNIRTLAEAEAASRKFTDSFLSSENAGWIEPVRPARHDDHRQKPKGSTSSSLASALTQASAVRAEAFARIDSFAFRHRVFEIMSAPAIFAAPQTNCAELAQLLDRHKISAAFIGAANDVADACGIVTERDLMRLLISAENAAQSTLKASTIMSTPLITIPAQAYLYQALGLMARHKLRHLAVVDEDNHIIGAVSSADLMRLRAGDALLMDADLDAAPNRASLAAAWSRLPAAALSLLEEGVGVRDITGVVSEEICAATRRACQLAEQQMLAEGLGAAPVSYAVLVLGSGGRGETLLAPDQDNAILYADCDAGIEDKQKIDKWFEDLATRFAATLNEIGIPFCNGGVMAKNSEWRHSLSGWKQEIDHWLTRGDWKDVCYVDIFYDFRTAYGNAALAQELRQYAWAKAHKAPGFLKQMAIAATDFDPPFTLLGNIKTQTQRIDLKKSGLLALIGGARILALRHGLGLPNEGEKAHMQVLRSTKARLEATQHAGLGNAQDIHAVIDAHEILLNEILHQQLTDIACGIPPSNKVEVKVLSPARLKKLKWALKQIEPMTSLVGDPLAFG